MSASTSSTASEDTIDLHRSSSDCSDRYGVYPVRVQLVDTSSGNVLDGFTTDLVYTDASASTNKVRLATVVPFSAPLRPAASVSSSALRRDPLAALTGLSKPSVATLAALVEVLAERPDAVPVTIDASPQTLQALENRGDEQLVANWPR